MRQETGSGKTVLVTGASGFIGANLFRTLAAVRDDVYGVVRRARNWRLADVGDEHIVAVDLNDAASTKNLVNTIGPQTVFDTVAYGAYSFEEEAGRIYQTNVQSIVNLVELLHGRTTFSAFLEWHGRPFLPRPSRHVAPRSWPRLSQRHAICPTCLARTMSQRL